MFSASCFHARSDQIGHLQLPMVLQVYYCSSTSVMALLLPIPNHPRTETEDIYTYLKICIIDIFKYQSWCLWLQERILVLFLFQYLSGKWNTLMLHCFISPTKPTSMRGRFTYHRVAYIEYLFIKFYVWNLLQNSWGGWMVRKWVGTDETKVGNELINCQSWVSCTREVKFIMWLLTFENGWNFS